MKTCTICGREFETSDQRRRYCSQQCAYRARLNHNSSRMRACRTEDKWEWAQREAETLNYLASDYGIDKLADYVYNNYKQTKG